LVEVKNLKLKPKNIAGKMRSINRIFSQSKFDVMLPHAEFQLVCEVCEHIVLFSLLLWDSSLMQFFSPVHHGVLSMMGVCL